MLVKDIKDLEKVIRLCRKTGVDAIKVDNIELHLGKAPLKPSSKPKAVFQAPAAPEESIKVPQFNGLSQEPIDDVETDGLTEEQLLYYSAATEAQ